MVGVERRGEVVKPEDIAKKWLWMMDYCRKKGLSPGEESHWKEAEEAWLEIAKWVRNSKVVNGSCW